MILSPPLTPFLLGGLKGGRASFEKILARVKREMADYDITNGEQINDYLKRYFDNNTYKGIIIENQPVPTLKPGQFVIRNADVHWSLIYNKDGQVKEWNSYGTNILDEIPDAYVPKKDRQGGAGYDDQSCGQRSITAAIMLFKPSKFF